MEGLERCRQARWKHGRYSSQALVESQQLRALMRSSKQFLSELPTQKTDADLDVSPSHPSG
jgi:hypothetical protein